MYTIEQWVNRELFTFYIHENMYYDTKYIGINSQNLT